jgi:hypothetical protein
VPSYDQAFDALREVVLEESWVLRIDAQQRRLSFDLDVVLTPRHSLYAPPPPTE